MSGVLDSGQRQDFLYSGEAHKFFKLADVTGTPVEEILSIPAKHPKVLEVRKMTGESIAAISSKFYITDFDAADFDRDGLGEIVLYEYPIARRKGAFRIVRLTGETICQWETTEVVGGFTILDWPGQEAPVILTNPGEGYLVAQMCGEQVAYLPAPNASWFRSMEALWFDDGQHLVIAASGSGYRPYHLLSIFSVDGEPVHHEAGENRVYALSRASEGFFLGAGNEVSHYEIGTAR